jgi:hypothetical protein
MAETYESLFGTGEEDTVPADEEDFSVVDSGNIIDQSIAEASLTYDVPEDEIREIIRVESNYDPDAVSKAGAQGLMQLMPNTAKEMGVTDSFDPRQNIFGGTRYYSQLKKRYGGNRELAHAAYNAGPTAVDKAGGVPNFPETKGYLKNLGFTGVTTVKDITRTNEYDDLFGKREPEDEAADEIFASAPSDEYNELFGTAGDPLSVRGSVDKGYAEEVAAIKNNESTGSENPNIVTFEDAVEAYEGEIMGTHAGRVTVKSKMNKLLADESLELTEDEAYLEAMRDTIFEMTGKNIEDRIGSPKPGLGRTIGGFWEGLKGSVRDTAIGIESGIVTMDQLYDREEIAEDPIAAMRRMVKSEQIDPYELGKIQVDVAELMENGISESEATGIAMSDWLDRMNEMQQGRMDFFNSIAESDALEGDERYQQSSGITEEVASAIGGSVGDLPVYAVHWTLGMAKTYARIKGSLFSEISDKLEETHPEIPEEGRRMVAEQAASLGAGAQTPLESIGKITQIATILGKKGFKKFAVGMGATYFGETATEYLQQYPEEWAIMWALNQDLSHQELKEFFIEKLPEIHERAKYAGKVGGYAGLFTAGAGRVVAGPMAHYISAKQQKINNTREGKILDERTRVQEEQLDAIRDEDGDNSVEAVGSIFEKKAEPTTVTGAVKEQLDLELRPTETEQEVTPLRTTIKERVKDIVKNLKPRLLDRVSAIKQLSIDAYKHAVVYPGKMDMAMTELRLLETQLPELKGHHALWDRWLAARRIEGRAARNIVSPMEHESLTKLQEEYDAAKAELEESGQKVEQVLTIFGVNKPTAQKIAQTPQEKLMQKKAKALAAQQNKIAQKAKESLIDEWARTKDISRAQAKTDLEGYDQIWREWVYTRLVVPSFDAGLISEPVFNELYQRKQKGETYSTMEVLDKIDDLVEQAGIPSREYFSVGSQKVVQRERGASADQKVDSLIDATLRKFVKAKVLIERNRVARIITSDPKVATSGSVFERVYETPEELAKLKAQDEKAGKTDVKYRKKTRVKARTEDIISVMENGERFNYVVDKEVAQALKNLTTWQAPRWVAMFNNVFRKSATVWNPGFAYTNAIRDTFLSYVASPAHRPLGMTRTFFRNLVQGKGVTDSYLRAMKNQPFAFDWLRGIYNGTGAAFGAPETITTTGQTLERRLILVSQANVFDADSTLFEKHFASGGGFGWTAEEVKGRPDIGEVLFKDSNNRPIVADILASPAQIGKLIEKINEAIEYAPRLGVRHRIEQVLQENINKKVYNKYQTDVAKVLREEQARKDQYGDGSTQHRQFKTRTVMPLYNRIHSEIQTEMAFISRQSGIDFNRGGTTVKLLNQFVPFFNARVQGTSTLLRALAVEPEFSVAKDQGGSARREALIKYGIVNVMPTMAAYAFSQMFDPDGEKRKDIPNYVKRDYWVFPYDMVEKNGKLEPKYMLIPKGEVGKLSNLFEQHLYENYGGDADFLTFTLEYLGALSPIGTADPLGILDKSGTSQAISSVLPPWAKAVQTFTSGYDLYRDRPLETAGMQNDPVYARFKQNTPEVYKWFSKWMYDLGIRDERLSPVRLQQMAADMTTFYGQQGFSPERMAQNVANRLVRTQGGAVEEHNWDLVNKIDEGYKELRYEVEQRVANGDRRGASALITQWNKNIREKINEVDISSLKDLGIKIKTNQGLFNAYRVEPRKRANWMSKRKDERKGIVRKLEGRQ